MACCKRSQPLDQCAFTDLELESWSLPKIVAYLAEGPSAPQVADGDESWTDGAAIAISSGDKSFFDLMRRPLSPSGERIEAGDTIRIYDWTCIDLETTTLVRTLFKYVSAGVTVEIFRPRLSFAANSDDAAFRMLAGLDEHWRHKHGEKTHKKHPKVGRKPLLQDDDLPKIRAMLEESGANVTNVAKKLGVGRSTLFDFLDRHKHTA
ncbi:hypothetical protein MTsPCn3_31970 [Erythrobacter sp. MTPC3]